MKAIKSVLLVQVILLSVLSRAHADVTDVYRRSITSVVWIVNYLPQRSSIAYGSGALIDLDRQLAVTNFHVADDEDEMDVYFPVRDSDGKLIVTPEYYVENRDVLMKLGYASVGRVVARDREKDIAILRLSRLPSSATALSIATADPADGESVNMLGNPGCVLHRDGDSGFRGMWRWSRVTVNGVRQYAHYFPSDDLSVDFLALHYVGDTFGGNSGGPIVNDKGELVGICQSSGGDAEAFCRAVYYREVQEVLDTVQRYRVFSIQNRTQYGLAYSVKWGDRDWETYSDGPGVGRVFWYAGDDTPYVRFDYDLTGDSTYREYRLESYTAHYGCNRNPDLDADAREYYLSKAGDELLELYSVE